MKKLFIIGSGGFSKQVIEIVEKINEKSKEYELIGLIDDNQNLIGKNILGYKVIGTTDFLKNFSKKHTVYGVITIADGDARREISQNLDFVEWINLIHPNSVVSKYVKIGKGNIICGGVVINPECDVGDQCHINIGSTVGHDVSMQNYVTIMPGSRISGNVRINSNSMVGTGSIIIQGLIIGENVMLGAGSVVTKNAISNSLYMGVPAKKIRDL